MSMSVFDQPFLFMDNPAGGTDQLNLAKAQGFMGAFGNVIDFPASAWDVHRAHAKQAGMWFGPWGRTGHPPPQGIGFEWDKANEIKQVALSWGAPFVLNTEKEVDNSGDTITRKINALVGDLDCALSTEAWPFSGTDWAPVGHLPVLPQIFPQDWWPATPQMWGAETMKRAEQSKAEWHRRGVRCVYYTFGSYGLQLPRHYNLQAPYSLFTADAIGIQNYPLWKPTIYRVRGVRGTTEA